MEFLKYVFRDYGRRCRVVGRVGRVVVVSRRGELGFVGFGCR